MVAITDRGGYLDVCRYEAGRVMTTWMVAFRHPSVISKDVRRCAGVRWTAYKVTITRSNAPTKTSLYISICNAMLHQEREGANGVGVRCV